MNIRDFEYLIAIDELKSFVKASNKCFISQPALSQQVKKIEGQLGFDIFERDRKHIITTNKGKEVIKYAKSILASHKQIKQINNQEIVLKIALIPTICPYLLPHIVDELHKKLPNVKFYFLELKTEELITKLNDGDIDIGILAYFSSLIDDRFRYKQLYDEEFLLTLPKKSKLNQDDFVQIMKDKKLVLLEEGNCMSDNIKEICDIYEQNSYSDFYATNIETVKNMLRINDLAALLPQLSCVNENNLKILPFKSKKTREIGSIVRKSFNQIALLNMVNDIIGNVFITLLAKK